MLFVLIGFMLLASTCLLCLKKDRALWFLLGMCGSLMIQFSGILIFIAKKGGYSKDILHFLFFSTRLKMKAQYLYITLDALGYMIGVGRYLFPVFLLELALHYSMLPLLRRRPFLSLWALVLPTVSLICYYPPLFRAITRLWPWAHNVLVQGCYFWIIAYVAAALLLLLQELFAITIHFCKRQFAYIVLYLIALSGLYLLYCGQDPAQVYCFYSYDYIWNKGVGYLQYAPSIGGYTILVVVNVICGSLGFFSLMNYTRDTVLDGIEETGLERRFDIARTGASVFVHSIKNQLLANRVLEKRMQRELEKKTPDIACLRDWTRQLRDNNELLLERCAELYGTVRRKSVTLMPVTLAQIGQTAAERFARKYPEAPLEMRLDGGIPVLADRSYLSEALYNLMTNAWEANTAAGRTNSPVAVVSHAERLYTLLEVRDVGNGVSRAEQRKIFEPFYSSKNSSSFWGMGLYHARAIVRAHLGHLRVESRLGQGTSFFIMLPRCGAPEKETAYGHSHSDRR